jgi:hypothetical protein
MATERSDKLNEAARDGQQKFDYFILGVIGAVCAFIGQSFRPQQLGINPSSLELIAVLTLFGAGVAGFKRIEGTNRVLKMNSGYLYFQEVRGAIVAAQGTPFINAATGRVYSPHEAASNIAALDEVIPKAKADLDQAGNDSLIAYKWRNRLLFAGFILFIGSRVWSGYV